MLATAMPYSTSPPIPELGLTAGVPPEAHTGVRPLAPPGKDDQNRRSACDRCRRQKLRCERRASATLLDACKRCLKSRSKCVTGPSLPMGRPRIRTRSTSPFDYRAVKRDYPSGMADFAPHCGPSVSRAKSSPLLSTAGLAGLHHDMAATAGSMNEMMPPTTLAMLDMPVETKMGPSEMYVSYGNLYPAAPAVAPPPPSEPREESIRNLYDLCAHALAQCHAFASQDTQWSMGHSGSIDSIVAGMANHMEPGLHLTVTSLLETSNEFLRLSQALVFSSPHKSPLSSRHSSIDHTNASYSVHAYQQLHQAGITNYSPVTSPAYDDKDTNFSPSSIPSLSSSVATTSPGIPERLDFPTTLTLYTCYSTILRLYRTVLTRLHVTLLSQPLPWSALESILPGIYAEGVQGDQRPDLQVKMFLQVCRDTLDQMERNITFSTKFFHGGADAELLRTLVETIVKAEAAEGAARIVSPKALVDEILRTLDGGLGV